MAELTVLDARVDRDQWLELLKGWPVCEAYTHPEYLDLYADHGARPVLLVLTRPGRVLLYPIILRSLQSCEWWGEARPAFLDAVTPPYGWAGPFSRDAVGDDDVEAFFDAYREWAMEAGLVCEYALFCPARTAPPSYPGELVPRMPVVVREFPASEDDLWRSYEHKVRKNVNRARASGLRVEIDRDGRHLDAFLRVFHTTLERRSAAARYYFQRPYFTRIMNGLRDGAVFFHVFAGDEIVSTELVITGGRYLYSFLGGTSEASFALRPNDLLKHEVNLWGMREGYHGFILGAGTVPDDGIFRYKSSFAPEGIRQLVCGKWIANAAAYEEAVQARRVYEQSVGKTWSIEGSYFPAYRAP